MQTFLLVAIVILGLVALTQQKRSHRYHRREIECPDGASEMDACGKDNHACAWNKCTCPGGSGCKLICTDNPQKLCYGHTEDDNCLDTSGSYVCLYDSRATEDRKLVCVFYDRIA